MAGCDHITAGPRRKPAGRRRFAGLALALAFALAGCAAPPTGTAGSGSDPAPARSDVAGQPPAASSAASTPPSAAMPPRSKPAPPKSDPLPAQRVPDERPTRAATAPKLDLSCRTSADCVVKDVGNCCGYFPRCVNVNAAVDPKAVQAQCARTGMASVCGFKPVEGCECVKGECQDQPMTLDVQ